MSVGANEIVAYIAAMSRETRSANRFRAFRVLTGLEENNPSLVQAVEALRKCKAGEFTVEVTEAAVGPIFEAWAKVREALPGVVAVPAEVDPAVFLEMLSWRITV